MISEAEDATRVTASMKSTSGNQDHLFRFVTNHAHVLQVIAADPTARLRDIAQTVGITERTTGQIVNDLEQAGYLSKSRDGRRHHTVGDLIRFLEAPAPRMTSKGSSSARAKAAVQPHQRRRR